MPSEIKPTPEQVEAARNVASIVADSAKSFGHLGFAMGQETYDAIAQFLASRDAAMKPDAERERLRDAVVEAARNRFAYEHGQEIVDEALMALNAHEAAANGKPQKK